jgi:DNA invertase Pin-like site-specific DNA recombinase
MKAVLYCRVSTGKQFEKNLSIPDQLKQLREYCTSQGYTIYKEFIEDGASATDDRRPVFQEMIAEAMQKDCPFSVILVLTTSRFFRDAYLAKFYKKRLKKKGIKVKAIHQPVSEGPSGELVENIFEAFDQHESQMNAYNTLRGMRENARRGFWNGSTPKFGFRCESANDERGNAKKRIALNPSETPTVEEIYERYLSLEGAKQIAESLNRKGATYRDRPWTKNTVLNILSDPAYRGTFYFNKFDHRTGTCKPKEEWIKIDIPSIVPDEIWERAQVIRREREPKRTNPAITGSKTLLTGICFCGICGRGMQMETGKGGNYTYYNCRGYVRSGKSTCPGQRIPAQELENSILNHMSHRLFTKERIKKILSGVISKSKSVIRGSTGLRNTLTQERKDIEKRLQHQYDAIERGLVSTCDVSERIRELNTKRDQIDDQIKKVQVPVVSPSVFTDRSIEDFQRTVKVLFLDSDRDFTKRYLKLFIDRITINGSQVRIEGKPVTVFAAMQNKTAVKNGVLTAVDNWLPGQDSNLQPSG